MFDVPEVILSHVIPSGDVIMVPESPTATKVAVVYVIPSEADDETFPAVSLNQTYTVREWFPADEALDSVKLTVAE